FTRESATPPAAGPAVAFGVDAAAEPGVGSCPDGSKPSERAQEVQNFLLLPRRQAVEVADDPVRLGGSELRIAAARVLLDGSLEITRAPIVQEEQPLSGDAITD
ncbi:MAG TPA: hypothetical protein VJ764_06015, partial [Steroidobacteraceae bacterium]|nr:hypothetical protein [Steroidobacteraceae bacterium]